MYKYKYILACLVLTTITLNCFSQTYNPSIHTVTNKAIGIAQATSTDGRTLFFDVPNQLYRAYKDTAEVKSYLNLAKYRTGGFDILVNSGGVLNSGVIVGGVNSVWYFRNGTADSNLVLKIPVVAPSRFGVAGEDDAATQDRTFDLSSRVFKIQNGTGNGKLQFSDNGFIADAVYPGNANVSGFYAQTQAGSGASFSGLYASNATKNVSLEAYADGGLSLLDYDFTDGTVWSVTAPSLWHWELNGLGESTSDQVLYINSTTKRVTRGALPAASTYYNSNIGAGYRLAVPNTNNIKTLNPGYGILNDSTTASNTITQTLDTANVFPAVRATILTDRIYPEKFGAVGDGVTDDAAAFQSMYDWIAAQPYRTFIIGHANRVYLINDTVFLPKTITGASADLRRIKIEGSGVTYLKTNTGPMFYRKPNDATEAGSIISYYTLTIDGLTIKGNSTAGQVGLDIAALYTPVITGCSFVTLDTAVLAKFWLNGRIENNFFTLNKSIGFKGSSGEYYWSGATTTNSAFNIDLFSGNRIFNQVNSYAGLMFLAADGVIVRDHISEGSNPRYDIYNDSQAGGVDGMRFENIWFESTGGSALNTCFYFRNGGITYINGLQNGYADTLFKFENTLNSSHFVVENIGFYPPTGKIFDAGGVSLGASVTMSVGNMYKTYADMLVDTARWVGGVVGPQTTVLSDGQLKSVSTNISLKPNMYASKTSRSIVLEGTLLSPVDDGDAGNYGIGGYFNGASNRPHIGWFGTGGLWVDATTKYGWGTSSASSDFLSRPVAGRYSFNGTGQLRIPSGATAQRLSGASGDIRANTDTVGIEYWDATAGAFRLLASREWARNNYQSKIFLNVKDFGATGDGTTNDAPAIQSVFTWISANPASVYTVIFPPGNYKVNSTITLPGNLATVGESVRLLIQGYGARLFTTAAIAIFERVPTSQSQALNSYISNWIPEIKGLLFDGNATTGQVGIRIGATYSMVIEDCNFSALDTGIVNIFGLQSSFRNIRMTNNKSENFFLTFGERWGGTDANSASNSNSIENCRVFGASGAYSHIHADAANGVVVDNFISEGSKPFYNIILDSRASTTVTFCDVSNIHVEANGGVYANNTVFRIRSGGVFKIRNVYLQYADTLFNSENSGSSSTIVFDGIPYIGALPAGVAFNAGAQQFLGYNIIFKDVAGGTTFKNKLFNSASWAGGVLPIELYFDYEKGSGSGAKGLTAGGTISLEPGLSSSSQSVQVGGYLLWPSDNTYDLGVFSSFGNYRPRNIYAGTGVYADNAGSIGWGASAVTSDVRLVRDSVGRVGIKDNSSNYRDIKLRGIIATELAGTGTSADSVIVIEAATRRFKTVLQSSIGAYTFTSGLTNTSGTVTNDFFTGKAGGGTLYGGTASGENITVSSTANATKGKIFLGASSAYDEVNTRLGLGNSAPTTTLDVTGAATVSGNIGYGSIGGTGTNFYTASQTNAATTVVTSQYMFGGITSLSMRVGMRGQNSTTIPNNNGYASFVIGEQAITEGTSGTHAFVGQAVIKPMNVTAGSAAVTRAATLMITNAGNAATTGHNDALLVDTGYLGINTGMWLKGTGTYDWYLFNHSNDRFAIGTGPKTTSGSLTPGLQIDTFRNVYAGSTFLSSFPTQSTGGNFYSGGNMMVGAGVFENYFIATSNATLTDQQHNVYVDATSGNVTITLPGVSTVVSNSGGGLGIVYNIKRIDASGNTVSVVRSGSDTIDGATSFTLASMEVKTIQAIGTTTWYVR